VRRRKGKELPAIDTLKLGSLAIMHCKRFTEENTVNTTLPRPIAILNQRCVQSTCYVVQILLAEVLVAFSLVFGVRLLAKSMHIGKCPLKIL